MHICSLIYATMLSGTRKFKPVYLEVTVLVSILLVYWRSLLIWFDWETVRFFVQPRSLQYRWLETLSGGWVDLSDYGIKIASLTFRPLMTWSFQIESLLFGKWAPGYHLFNLAAHLACVWLLIRLLRKAGTSVPMAATAGFLFGLHPLTTQPLWILGDRAEVCVLLGGLFALYHYGANRFLSSLGLLFALYSKETAVTIPAWLLCYDLIFLDRCVSFRRTLKFRFSRIIIPSVLTAIYLLHRYFALGGIGGYNSVDHSRLDYIREVLSYNLAWILTLSRGYPFLISGIIIALVFIILPWTSRISRFGLIWFFLFLLPLSNLCNKWYLYTPVAAAVFIIAGIFDPLFRKPRFQLLAASVLLIVSGYLSILSYAEINHQLANSKIPLHLAQKLKSLKSDLPENQKVVFLLTPPFKANKLDGHFFNPAEFMIKDFKPPSESIVWDLNATRYEQNLPVWTRSVEAAVRLLYDDISIRVELSDLSKTRVFNQDCLYINYDPLADSLKIQE